MIDLQRVRRDFPALAQTVNGAPLVYLDNAATAQKPRVVIDEVMRVYTECCGNVQRGVHTLGARATFRYEAARATVASLIGAATPEEIVFTSGCTASINLVAYSWGDTHVRAGDEIIVSDLEHHSNLLPWQELCARRGAKLRRVPLTEAGELRLDVYAQALSSRTRLVAISQVSNALGTLTPVREMARLAHDVGARVLIDGAQAVSRMPVDVTGLGADFYAFSGHKLYGPFGIGALYARTEVLAEMPPFMTGGGMVDRVGAERSSFGEPPRRFEAGTPNVAGAVGLAKAIDYVRGLGLEAIQAHDRSLVEYARRSLAALPGVRLIGSAEAALGVVSFVMADVHPHDVATILDQRGVAVRAGHHCAQLVMDHYAVSATVRASFAVYNHFHDVDALVHELQRVREVFGL